jgi:hypothetical protein
MSTVAARPTARAKAHAGTARILVALLAAVVIPIVGARIVGPHFHPCERLDARLCADLGPEACAVWKGKLGNVGSGSAMPHEAVVGGPLVHRATHLFLGWDNERSHETCVKQGSDAVYPAILEGVRATVAAQLR